MPARSAHHRRAHASATKLAIVAPVVSTPPIDAGRPNSSFNQSIDTCSSRAASGVDTHAPGFWSVVEASQSAPRAAGVTPPSTKWKNFGPAECTAPSNPATSSSSACTAPTPCSGNGPPNVAATSSARGSRTARSASVSRYSPASRAAKSTTFWSSDGSGLPIVPSSLRLRDSNRVRMRAARGRRAARGAYPGLMNCTICGSALPQGARFCPSCGAVVNQATSTNERKVVTVLFADLVDSTGLSQRLDPERAREVLGRFYDVAVDELVALRGRPEKFIGDAVMAVFGLPRVHEDDALRAVRAAADMQGALRALNSTELENFWGVTLTNRIGVNTGEVVAGDPAAGQRLVTGDAVNVAAR